MQHNRFESVNDAGLVGFQHIIEPYKIKTTTRIQHSLGGEPGHNLTSCARSGNSHASGLILLRTATGDGIDVDTRDDGHTRSRRQLRSPTGQGEQRLHHGKHAAVLSLPLFRRGIAAATEKGSQESSFSLCPAPSLRG